MIRTVQQMTVVLDDIAAASADDLADVVAKHLGDLGASVLHPRIIRRAADDFATTATWLPFPGDKAMHPDAARLRVASHFLDIAETIIEDVPGDDEDDEDDVGEEIRSKLGVHAVRDILRAMLRAQKERLA